MISIYSNTDLYRCLILRLRSFDLAVASKKKKKLNRLLKYKDSLIYLKKCYKKYSDRDRYLIFRKTNFENYIDREPFKSFWLFYMICLYNVSDKPQNTK